MKTLHYSTLVPLIKYSYSEFLRPRVSQNIIIVSENSYPRRAPLIISHN